MTPIAIAVGFFILSWVCFAIADHYRHKVWRLRGELRALEERKWWTERDVRVVSMWDPDRSKGDFGITVASHPGPHRPVAYHGAEED